ncbi:cell wall hydrolase [Rhizobium sp. SGZ-381]|uniref:cell wall hydrolase n=1 Tax=Rhizobium sp. SGZ-381 TaxID=3342800 RepID=UPI00366F83D9
MSRYKLVQNQTLQLVKFYVLPSESSPHVEGAPRLLGGDIVTPTGKSAERGTWIEISYQTNPVALPLTGWILATFLGAPADDGAAVVPPVDEGAFVSECIRCELADADGGTVGCDYLIAWALIETSLTNFAAQLSDPTALGPFQISTTEWDAYVASGLNVTFGPDGRLSGYAQVDCAAWMAERDAKSFGEGMASRDYITSLLNIFHSRLIGVDAAVAVQKAINAKTPATKMDEIFSACRYDKSKIDQLLKDRKKFIGDAAGTGYATVDAFVTATSTALETGLEKAFDLIEQYVPEFITPVVDATVAADWMAAADKEFADWKTGGFVETSGAGQQRVSQYFDAATNPHTSSEPWCGAFAAWCLEKGGAEQYQVFEPEVASHWTQWGDLELRQRDYDSIPRGAIVVLSPQDNTSGSGHVAFFDKKLSTDQIQILGGNQSDLVTTIPASRGKIVAIRWLSTLNPAPELPLPGPAPGGHDTRNRIILARTLYGEARDQGKAGLEAVANVVMNRAKAKSWFGKTVEHVCLKNKQFSCWNAGDINRAKIVNLQPNSGDAIFDQCFAIAGDAIAGTLVDQTGGATHFHADTMKRFPDWAATMTPTAHIGAHIFYKKTG